MKKILVSLSILLLVVGSSYGQTVSVPFFHIIPKPEVNFANLHLSLTTPNAGMWAWRPVATGPIVRYEGNSVNATTIGGGIAYQHLVYDSTSGRWNSTISLSPLTLLIGQNGGFDFSYASTVGFFNGLFVVGGGWDFTNKKPFGLITANINLNN